MLEISGYSNAKKDFYPAPCLGILVDEVRKFWLTDIGNKGMIVDTKNI